MIAMRWSVRCLDLDRPLLVIRAQCSVKDFMAAHRFIRRGAAEAFAKLAGVLRGKGRQHLLEAIREAGFEYASGHDRKCALAHAHVVTLPDLLLAPAEVPQRLRFLGRVAHAAFRAEDLQIPRIHLARSE